MTPDIDNPATKSRLGGIDGGPLLRWYRENARDLPWRQTRDPYAIWISEIMCQQTQIDTVLPYYKRWMARFPDVASLAQADEQEVLSLWQGLGYYRRCKLLLQGAKHVFHNGMPATEGEWRKVPGVGPYTAAAIASIAFNEPAAVVDGNVERVFARLTGNRATGPALKREAWAWARRNLFWQSPGEWNQAVMELGAIVCTPRNPKCPCCPVSVVCSARQSWTVDELPVPRRQDKLVHLTHLVWVPWCGDKVGVRQIPSDSWWSGMWEFPREDATQGPEEAAQRLADTVQADWSEDLGAFRHSVTHHRIQIHAYLVRTTEESPGLTWLTLPELAQRAMPSPQRKILKMAQPFIG